MERRLLLDVVVRQRAAVLELLARKDQTLLVRRDPLLVLDLRLHVVDRVGTLDLERDGLPRQGLDEDLHSEKSGGLCAGSWGSEGIGLAVCVVLFFFLVVVVMLRL